jgi:hypothetical protein
VYSKRDGREIRKRFDREADAKSWRVDQLAALSRGTLRAPTPTTVGEAWGLWLAAAQAGTILNRGGERYKPATIRAYEKSMRLRVLPTFEAMRLSYEPSPAARNLSPSDRPGRDRRQSVLRPPPSVSPNSTSPVCLGGGGGVADPGLAT